MVFEDAFVKNVPRNQPHEGNNFIKNIQPMSYVNNMKYFFWGIPLLSTQFCAPNLQEVSFEVWGMCGLIEGIADQVCF